MRAYLIAALAMGLLALSPQEGQAVGKALTWQRHSYADLGFSAEFPGAVERQDAPIQTATTPMPTANLVATDGPVTFLVATTDVTGHFNPSDGPKALSAKVMAGALRGRTAGAGPTAMQTEAGAAFEAVSTDDKTITRNRAFVSGSRTYSIMVIAPVADTARVSDAAAMRFLNSLRLSSQGAEAATPGDEH
jgi:hypothetical protein